MAKIKVMDEILANKIAAGEVVEKTMNVVKELVENSIDAKSDEITIKLIDSGVKEIEVSDNGLEDVNNVYRTMSGNGNNILDRVEVTKIDNNNYSFYNNFSR